MHDEWSEAVDVRTQAADRLLDAATSGKPCPPVRDLVGSVRDGYAVQEINTRRALQEGRRLVGRKVGMTNAEVRGRFGIVEPDFGMLFQDRCHLDGQPIPIGDFLQPRVEGEVAFVLKEDLEGGPFTTAEVIRAVDFALAAIEVADSRIEGWDITPADTIADNASSGAFVLGSDPRDLRGLDLRSAAMTMTRNGEQVSSGSGAQVMEHPLNALVWLAGAAGRSAFPMRAGDVVLTGTLGPFVEAVSGDVFEVRIDGLGSVRAAFG
ncbi:2-keto-4-pentenoate hydratase [Nonomuraea endophytica]|uniref:2-keto-4-pentenoate hydratase n=1 Tax=Nonomuraea endophytica TaxID=714136 RepID=A0A7W8AAR0_9ACTN|nr:fumarylacetoacetate hydrolase family protein [Nonomuraea endophytica]MBB5082787.1 2-keto-4-pentenoate hydratase [Nonomuraea endophytica]